MVVSLCVTDCEVGHVLRLNGDGLSTTFMLYVLLPLYSVLLVAQFIIKCAENIQNYFENEVPCLMKS